MVERLKLDFLGGWDRTVWFLTILFCVSVKFRFLKKERRIFEEKMLFVSC